MAENKAPLQKRDWVPSRKTSRQAKKATKKDDTTSKLHRVDHFFIHSWGRETLLLLKMNQDGGIENTGKIADPYQLVGCLSKLEPHKDLKTFSALNWCDHFSSTRTRRRWVRDRMVPFQSDQHFDEGNSSRTSRWFFMAACDASWPPGHRWVNTISKAPMKNIERFKQDVTILLHIFGENCQLGGSCKLMFLLLAFWPTF